MTARRAFTLTEVIVATGILSLFLAGMFSLFSSGQSASSAAFWLQKTATALRNTTRHVSDRVQKSSYPSTLVYPGKIAENTRPDFCLHVNQAGSLKAVDCLAVESKTSMATKILWFTESLPEKRGFESEVSAFLTYHVYSLSKGGQFLYHRFQETIPLSDPSSGYISGLSRPAIPPPSATLVESKELVTDVDHVDVGIQSATATGTPVTVEIGCLYPRGKTTRLDRLTVVPNVAAVVATP